MQYAVFAPDTLIQNPIYVNPLIYSQKEMSCYTSRINTAVPVLSTFGDTSGELGFTKFQGFSISSLCYMGMKIACSWFTQ